ncbi:MAG: protein kinase [Bryobacteraceae bacterium]
MSPDRWRRIEELYHAAAARPAHEHRVFLEQACPSDPALREEVASLLQHAPSDSPTRTVPLAGRIQEGSTLGHYRIEQRIGAGGMGEVFRAVDTRLNRNVAIKVSHGPFSLRFRREALVLSSLNHPHICTLFDVGPDFIVMELVEGETLQARLQRGALPLAETARLGAQIADALAEAHAKGITHRDLKPGNVMVTKKGVKLLDFGLAGVGGDTLTKTGAVMGTPAYMAPEQWDGKECDARSDIFSFGLLLCEMATGKRVGQGQRPDLGAIPEKLAHTIERCLETNPEDRWQTARDIKAELEWAAKPATGSGPVEDKRRGSLLWPIVTTLALAALAGLAWLHFREATPQAGLTYSAILPPENTSFDFKTNRGPISLSPDGRSMVFAATDGNGKSQLWVRALNTPTAQALPGTEGGMFPFWSPDSRWVGFFAGRMLKKIDTRGGPPIELAETAGALGGSWSASGTIVFASELFTPMRKVSSDGGKTSDAVAAGTEIGNAYGFPWFLPDGEHFLFSSWGGAGRIKLRVGSLGSTASTIVGEADSNAVYAEGHLFYLRQDSLMAQAFDSQSFKLSGEAVPIAEHVERFPDLVRFGAFSVSSSGVLAYQAGDGGAVKQLTWFDRDGKSAETVGEPRNFFDIELAPDGKRVAVSAPDGLGNYDLWMHDLSRNLATRFTVDPGGEYWVVWSADSKNVIFNSTRKGHYDLYRKSADGSGAEELLYADDTEKVPVSLSPDGKFLLYFTGGEAKHYMGQLALTPERPGGPLKGILRETGFNEQYPRFSPDGNWVAYDSDESGRSETYVAPFSRLTQKQQISKNGGGYPRWRRDGKAIFYVAAGGQLREVDVRVNAEAMELGEEHVIPAQIGAGGYSYDVSADGQRILVAVPAQSGRAAPVTLVQNWPAALTRLSKP